MHSAKGLEFDHVCILGLNAEVTPHGEGEADAQLENLRRLVGMAAGRARQSLVVGYKPDDASSVVEYFDPATFIEVHG
jgi:superfamily I DNA/RNA helicase